MSTIADLKYSLGSGAKTNKFKIDITKPTLVATLDGDQKVSTEKIPILVTATSLPEKSINTVNVMHRGRKFPIRDIAMFNESWSVTFYNDAKFEIRKYFEDWMYNIDRFDNFFTMDSFIQNNMILGYMQDITVSQLGCNDNKTIATYTLYHAFPTKIDSVNLNADETNQLSKTTITFTYSYWKRDETLAGTVKQTASGIKQLVSNKPIDTIKNALKGLF